MMILNNASGMCSFALSQAKCRRPSEVIIMTYGLWCGADKNGDVINNRCKSYQLLDYLDQNRDIKTTVGVGYDSVVPEVVIGTARCFESIRFIAINKLHSKCILMSNGLGIFGSANLTDSAWDEIILCNFLDQDSYNTARDIAMQQLSHGTVIESDFCNPDISGIV